MRRPSAYDTGRAASHPLPQVPSLKAYLHSDLHKKEWVGHMKPAGAKGPPIVFDSPLAMPL